MFGAYELGVGDVEVVAHVCEFLGFLDESAGVAAGDCVEV
jgi:hypothetical protein